MSRYCRICANQIFDKDYVAIDSCNLPLLMNLYLPEIIIEVVDPSICFKCFSVLQLFHTFRRNALRLENKVQTFADAHPEQTLFNLEDVLQNSENSEEPDSIDIDDSSNQEEEDKELEEPDIFNTDDSDTTDIFSGSTQVEKNEKVEVITIDDSSSEAEISESESCKPFKQELHTEEIVLKDEN